MDDTFDPIAYINTPRWQTSKLGLERTCALLARLGHPDKDMHFVHVAGTNGKGSTCAYIASILTAAGYKTGLFTSPYIEKFEERIRVDNECISAQELREVTLIVRQAASDVERELGDHPTEFELMFAVALEYFRRIGCDIVVVEVGLGGRLDATNIIEAPLVSVITRIGLDHTALLGSTLAEIAFEKAGIIKSGVPVVSWPQAEEAMEVIAACARDRACTISVPDFSELLSDKIDSDTLTRQFCYRGQSYKTRLLGAHQPHNAAVALETINILKAQGYPVPSDACIQGVADGYVPGRFEIINRSPLTIVDGAHNPQGACELVETLDDLCAAWADSAIDGQAQQRMVFMMGVLADKDYAAMIEAVLPLAHAFVTFEPDNPRALDAEDLARAIKEAAVRHERDDVIIQIAPTCVDAVSYARNLAGRAGMIVSFGSLYAVADAKFAFATNDEIIL